MVTPPSPPRSDGASDDEQGDASAPAPARLADRFKHLGRASSTPEPPATTKDRPVETQKKKRSTRVMNCNACRERAVQSDSSLFKLCVGFLLSSERITQLTSAFTAFAGSLRGVPCEYADAGPGPTGLTPLERNRSDIARLRREVQTLAGRLGLSQQELDRYFRRAELLVEAGRERPSTTSAPSLASRKRSFSSGESDSEHDGSGGDRRGPFGGKVRRFSMDVDEASRTAHRGPSPHRFPSPSRPGSEFRSWAAAYPSPYGAYYPHYPPVSRPIHSILYPAHGHPADPRYPPVILPYPVYAAPPPPLSRHWVASAPNERSDLPRVSSAPLPPVEDVKPAPSPPRPLRLPGFSTSKARTASPFCPPSSSSTLAASFSAPANAGRSLPPIVIPPTPTRRAFPGPTPATPSALSFPLTRPSHLATPATSVPPSSAAAIAPPPPNLVYRLPTPRTAAPPTPGGGFNSFDAFSTSEALVRSAAAVLAGMPRSGLALPPLKPAREGEDENQQAGQQRSLPSLQSELKRLEMEGIEKAGGEKLA
ncbi:hypothetical protein JCM10213_008487 [Rhodosporidiobolus nylandii]